MGNPRLLRLAAPFLILALVQSGAMAQSTAGSAGTEGDAAMNAETSPAEGSAPTVAAPAGGATRDITDAVPQLSAFGTVSKSADGSVSSTPASAELAAIVAGLQPLPPTGNAGPATAGKAAPLAAVKKSTAYPYRAVGQVEVTYGSNKYYCPGVLVGPSTVATAAQCLWGAEGNPVWTDNVVFYPGMNGKAPLGSVAWSGADIMQGFLDAMTTATSGGPLPYSIGLVTLSQPVGDKLGYFGFQTDLNTDYTANVITYGSGKTLHNMATTTCPVEAAQMYRSYVYTINCSAAPFGSPFFLNDDASGGKVLNGMKIYEYNDGSTGAARISAVTYEWITEHRS